MNDTTTRSTEVDALADLRTVLSLTREGRLRCSATTGRPVAATTTLLGERLRHATELTAFAWPMLLQGGGLAAVERGRLELTASGRQALERPAAEVVAGVWRRWPKHAPLDEFSRVEEIKGQRIAGVLTAAAPRRRAVADVLHHLPPGEWVDVDELFHLMRRVGLDFAIARSERARWRLYLVDPQYGSLGYDGYGAWPVVQGRYVLAVLYEYAATLGLLDVEFVDPAGARDDFRDQWGADDLDALSRYDGLLAVRITALGRFAAGLDAGYTPPAPPPAARDVQVLANLDVVAPVATPTDRALLDAFATRTSDHVWTLDLHSLLRAAAAGRPPAELGGFLADRAAHGVPPAVTTLIADASARLAAVRDLGSRRVLECADASTAALVARDRSLRAHVTLVGDRHLLVTEDAERRVRAALLRLGYVPGA